MCACGCGEPRLGGLGRLAEWLRRCVVSTAPPNTSADPTTHATLHPTHQVHCLYCFDVLASHLQRSQCPEPEFPTDTSYPLFVTWNKENQRGQLDLRGCIGEKRAPA